jgi:polysaccharide deacetylase family protein (PEP-CTERM system associated)
VALTHHHFTVDVEEYFQVSAFEPYVERSRWGDFESRVESNVECLLDLLAEHDAKGTFFTLGWIAERHPAMMRRVVRAGHEIASHGWDHRRVTELSRDEFRSSVRRTKATLEDLAGTAVLGYRAPSYSIVPGCEWALDILLEEGYRYDSSLFPVRRRGYGYPGGQRDPHWFRCTEGEIVEIPPATLRYGPLTLPAAGGGYLRHLPLVLVQQAMRDATRRGRPGTFYIHPWEVDPNQPRLDVPLVTRMRHYGGLRRTLPRLRRLMQEFSFRPVADSVARFEGSTERPPVGA